MTRDEILDRLHLLEEAHRTVRDRHEALIAEYHSTRWWQFLRRGEIRSEGRALVWISRGIFEAHRDLCHGLRSASL